MARSKRPKAFTAEDGRRVQFRQSAFAAAVRQKGTSKMEVFRSIAREMYPGEDGESVAARIKNWEIGCNGPSSLQDIRKLEKCMGVEKDAFLAELEDPETKKQKEADKNMEKVLETIASTALSAADLRSALERSMDKALYAMQQRQAARELYAYLQDEITQFYRVSRELLDHTDFWDHVILLPVLAPDCLPYREYLQRYPKIDNMIGTIRRLSLFLSRELKSQCEAFVYDLLGYGPYNIDELDMSLFSQHVWEQIEERMQRLGETAEDLDYLDLTHFFEDQRDENSRTLDEIFWEYVCD